MLQGLNLTQIKALANDIMAVKASVKLNKAWQIVHDELNLGKVINKQLQLSQQDRQQLKQIIEQDWGPLAALLTDEKKDRVSVAGNRTNEKSGAISPTAKELRIKTQSGQVFINQQQFNHPDHGGLIIDIDQINSIEHSHIVVVENLVAFNQWHHSYFAGSQQHQLKSAIVIYRGHQRAINNSNEFCRRFGATRTVFIASDLDPAGINIALTLANVNFVLWPQQSLFQQLALGNENLIAKQHQVINSNDQAMNKQTTQTLKYYQRWQITGKGYSQELMMYHKLSLAPFKLTTINL